MVVGDALSLRHVYNRAVDVGRGATYATHVHASILLVADVFPLGVVRWDSFKLLVRATHSRRGIDVEDDLPVPFDIFVAMCWDCLADVVYRRCIDALGRPELTAMYIPRLELPCAKRSKTDVAKAKFLAEPFRWNQASKAIADALPYGAADLLRPCSTKDCALRVQETCAYAFGAEVKLELIMDHISDLCINTIEPSYFLADTVCLSDLMLEFVGDCLGTKLRAYVHMRSFMLHDTFDTSIFEANITESLTSELVDRGASLQSQNGQHHMGMRRVSSASAAPASCRSPSPSTMWRL
jgi:hypothetical protein